MWSLTGTASADEVITFVRAEDGGVSVVSPAPNCLKQLESPIPLPDDQSGCPALGLSHTEALAWIRQQDVPADATEVSVQDRTQLPVDRTARDRWKKAGGVISIGPKILTAEETARLAKEAAIKTKLGLSDTDMANLKAALRL